MEELHLFIYGEIHGEMGGGMFSEGGPSVEEIQKELTDNPNAKEVIVHISSPGGGVFAGWTIGNIIKNSGKKTTARIEGLCASIATFIALSCDRVEMAETGRFIIHNPSNGMEGGEKEFEEGAKQLAKIKDDLIRSYRDKTGLSINQLSSMMDDETVMTAQEAKAQGFIDGFMEPLKAVAKFDVKNNNMPEVKTDPKIVSKIDQLLDRFTSLSQKLFPKNELKNIVVQLQDGGSIFIESEDDELEGKKAFLVDPEGNATEEAAPNGTHVLDDGRSITIEDGVVVSVQEEMTEEEKLKDKIKALEKQLTDSTKEREETAKAVEESKKEMSTLINEVKNLRKITVGDNADPVKPVIKPENKFDRKPEPKGKMEDFGEYLARKKGIKIKQ